ncbi:MAG: NAD(P)H nitroreductase [Clostridiales bacterium]|jgi:nitroreductase|nr:NAD(P)H nitroreductase [Clostridiales bacterium]
MIDLLMKRRSIRKFKDVHIEADKLEKLVKSVLLAPSGSNQRPWEFVFVTDRGLLETLATVRDRSSALLKDAALGIVLLGESDRRDTWIEDTTIAAILAQLTAHSIGLGSCWVHIRNRMHNDTKTAEQFVRELLEIPEQRSVECIIAVGYPDEQRAPRSEEDLEYDKVYRNKYGLKYR